MTWTGLIKAILLLHKFCLQLPEAAILRYPLKQVFLKILQFHKKTTVLESLFNNVAGLKKDSNTRVFLWILRNL